MSYKCIFLIRNIAIFKNKTGEETLKIADFSIAISETDERYDYAVDENYKSPEVKANKLDSELKLQCRTRNDRKNDVW